MAKACPVNFRKINENQIRIQALLITLVVVVFIGTKWSLLSFLLLYDFTVRLFISSKLSPITYIAAGVLKFFAIKKLLIDSGPKLFASKIGFLFALIIAVSVVFGLSDVATIFAIILAVCAGLEAFFNYCIGCKFYQILRHFNII